MTERAMVTTATTPAEPLADKLNPKYWAFRTLAAVVPRIPLPVARRLFAGAGAVAWAAAPALRRRAQRNLARVPSLRDDPQRLAWATRQVFAHLALNYLDFFRGRYVTYAELSQGWTIPNWDIFDRAMRSGRGAIVFGAHFGPFEYAGWKIGELGFSLLTPAERLRPERLNRLVGELRNHHHARLLPGDDRETLRALISSLREGQMAMFAIDRWVMGPHSPWPLFGEPAELPTAPFALAARVESPVFMLIPWRESDGRFGGAVEVLTPERLPEGTLDGASATLTTETATSAERGGGREAAIEAMRARVYPILERHINAHPEQWVSALSPVWDLPAEQASAPTPSVASSAGGAPSPEAPVQPSRARSVAHSVTARITRAATSGQAQQQAR